MHEGDGFVVSAGPLVFQRIKIRTRGFSSSLIFIPNRLLLRIIVKPVICKLFCSDIYIVK